MKTIYEALADVACASFTRGFNDIPSSEALEIFCRQLFFQDQNSCDCRQDDECGIGDSSLARRWGHSITVARLCDAEHAIGTYSELLSGAQRTFGLFLSFTTRRT